MASEDSHVKPQARGFNHHVVVGAAAKEILRSLLESSGYKVYPFGYESSLSTLKIHIWDRGFENTDIVQRIRSMPDYIVSTEKNLELIEVKFRRKSDKEGQPGVFLKNRDINRYKQFWGESTIVLLSPHGDRFFAQSARDVIPGSYETKWFPYSDFHSLSTIFPAVGEKLHSFSIAVDKLSSLWEDEKD